MARGRKKGEIQRFTKSIRVTQEVIDKVAALKVPFSVLVELGLKDLSMVEEIRKLKEDLSAAASTIERLKDELYLDK